MEIREKKANRIMIAGVGSGCGKTSISCAIMRALKNRGLKVSTFKCGPDYIDPMFHERVVGTKGRNLDPWFSEGKELREIISANPGDISIIEGVMGFYDGAGKDYSSHAVAMATDTPVILVIDAKGMSRSLGAVLKGFISFEEKTGIKGVIFNRLPESLVPMAKEFAEEYGLRYLGRFPVSPETAIESRHLGLITADEIKDIDKRLDILGDIAEKHLDLNGIIKIAQSAEDLGDSPEAAGETVDLKVAPHRTCARIAVAKDLAFCFYYENNLDLIRKMGGEIVYFSPISSKKLPSDISGIYIGGGYPELYLEEISENTGLMEEIRRKVSDGIPLIAECGGFMYLHSVIKEGGKDFETLGIIEGVVEKRDRLVRFGYTTLCGKSDHMLGDAGEEMKTHEFHYYDSTNNGESLMAMKLSTGKSYPVCHVSMNMYAGFPHLYFTEKMAAGFVGACVKYRDKRV